MQLQRVDCKLVGLPDMYSVPGAIAPPKIYYFIQHESNFIHHDFVQSPKNIHDIRQLCRPLFCRSSVVKYTSLLLP